MIFNVPWQPWEYISYHFRNKQWFQSKIAKFSHPCVPCATAEGVPVGIGYWQSESKHQNDGATRPGKKFDDIFSVQPSRYYTRTWQTDIHRSTARSALFQECRIASSGKKSANYLCHAHTSTTSSVAQNSIQYETYMKWTKNT